jgi:hypothetical protein
VVEQVQDLMNLYATGEFRGLFHVLHGVIAPLDGIGPAELGLDRLERRVAEGGITEIILATNPTLEGDTTAKQALEYMFLMKDELGREWLEPDLFRFGASALVADIERQLEFHVTGRYAAFHRHPMA